MPVLLEQQDLVDIGVGVCIFSTAIALSAWMYTMAFGEDHTEHNTLQKPLLVPVVAGQSVTSTKSEYSTESDRSSDDDSCKD